ncbi:hypothetical protein SAMN06265379_10442 [Saccharicrinis carchari]|uniref:Phosphate-selective porin O and P n=1 Tax=Saccharicrinis carchari TaxID=1168039 RepID=A0A521CYB2_SACCC|nr:hypothetical protein [Saccharicrinis carchari]SMO64447.1 hypothetical protein SAMN06265379_10442 [Saccharicrinis carchari]
MKTLFVFITASLICLPIRGQDENKEKPQVELHGALRFNYKLSSWKEGQKKRGGDWGYDMFAISPKAHYKGLTLDVEYRLYAAEYGGGLLRKGDITYAFNTQKKIKIGLTRVPFGIEPYNSHSYYLGMGYYMGLEDNYDMGVNYIHQGDKIEYQMAFFKNSEVFLFGDNAPLSNKTYSYDVTGPNREVNQFNAKMASKINSGRAMHKLGISAMYGGLYNVESEKMGNHSAWAVHYEAKAGGFSLKAQATSFRKNPKNIDSAHNDTVSLGAYNLMYELASKGELYTLGLSYNFPVDGNVLSNIQIYNDFAYFDKTKKEFEDSMSNTLGVLLHAGKVYCYVEYILSENQPWFGSEWTKAFSTGNPDKSIGIEQFININLGYYF